MCSPPLSPMTPHTAPYCSDGASEASHFPSAGTAQHTHSPQTAPRQQRVPYLQPFRDIAAYVPIPRALQGCLYKMRCDKGGLSPRKMVRSNTTTVHAAHLCIHPSPPWCTTCTRTDHSFYCTRVGGAETSAHNYINCTRPHASGWRLTVQPNARRLHVKYLPGVRRTDHEYSHCSSASKKPQSRELSQCRSITRQPGLCTGTRTGSEVSTSTSLCEASHVMTSAAAAWQAWV